MLPDSQMGSNEHMGITINEGKQTIKQKTEWVGTLQGTAESETRLVCSRTAQSRALVSR